MLLDGLLSQPGELLRAVVTVLVLLIFAGIAWLSFAGAETWEERSSVLDRWIPIVGTLMGAMGGYYFAKK